MGIKLHSRQTLVDMDVGWECFLLNTTSHEPPGCVAGWAGVTAGPEWPWLTCKHGRQFHWEHEAMDNSRRKVLRDTTVTCTMQAPSMSKYTLLVNVLLRKQEVTGQ